jgi:6-phosphogluconolactonase
VSSTEIAVHPSSDVLAAAIAARLITKLVDLQSSGGVPRIALTGGGVGTTLLADIRDSPARAAVDWSRIEFYWGDERFLPAGHPERNETQAREALLDHVDVDPSLVFPMGADVGHGPAGADEAAAEYADLLARKARPEDHGSVPAFDVMMLGMGPEGHCASIFPESPAVYETERTVVPVYNCPKPPPTRVSLTLPAIRTAAEVWLVTGGSSKAAAVQMALGGAGEVQLPVAGAVGRLHTRWLIDRDAAGKLPADISRL